MRLKLSLNCRPGSRIPFNYQYELSSWIYKTLAQAEPAFASWLHEQGYTLEGNKRFKFFTFSHLNLQSPFRPERERQSIRLDSGRAELILSFLLDDTLEHFVTGLFRQQQFGIGNPQFYPVDFTVQSVEILPKPEFTHTMQFRALSPICVAANEEGKEHAQYRHPNDADYTDLLINNLIQKMNTAKHYISHPDSKPVHVSALLFDLKSEPRQKGITLKAHTKGQTKVVGYTYDFQITAPPELLEIAYYAGFGTENAQGFGCVEIISSPNHQITRSPDHQIPR